MASGDFLADLAKKIAVPTTSQEPDCGPAMQTYLHEHIGPACASMGYSWAVYPDPQAPNGAFLIAHRHEDDQLPTVFTYGHGDVVRGLDEQWTDGRAPWTLERDGDRLYGRGTADNKGQHSINLAALAAVLAERGNLGFNSTILIETGEEIGSPGLAEFCHVHRDELRADVLIASDGPRLRAEQAVVFGGTRGVVEFDLTLELRAGGHHSGNWGGLIANAGLRMAHALACIADDRGQIKVPEWRPDSLTEAVKSALAPLIVDGGPDAPPIDHEWGELGLTPNERVFGWNSFEILAYRTGNPDRPVGAIPPNATARCQLRFVVGTDPHDILPALRRHLDAHGFADVAITTDEVMMNATRLDPNDPWAQLAVRSITETIGHPPDLVPNLGGSLPNEVFTDTLGMPTVWVPHSYPACSQHAPNEHLLMSVVEEGLRIMTGLFWDVGAHGHARGESSDASSVSCRDDPKARQRSHP